MELTLNYLILLGLVVSGMIIDTWAGVTMEKRWLE